MERERDREREKVAEETYIREIKPLSFKVGSQEILSKTFFEKSRNSRITH